jgi:hypothetical protein
MYRSNVEGSKRPYMIHKIILKYKMRYTRHWFAKSSQCYIPGIERLSMLEDRRKAV